jgi:hypothetical protein
MTFKDFLSEGYFAAKFEDPCEYGFAEDVLNNHRFPDFKHWSDIETYIVFRGAGRDAVKAAKSLFRQWSAECLRKLN